MEKQGGGPPVGTPNIGLYSFTAGVREDIQYPLTYRNDQSDSTANLFPS